MNVAILFHKGKGESYWDFLTNNQSWNIADGRNGNIAANSLHKYKEDVAILKDIGVSSIKVLKYFFLYIFLSGGSH